MHRTTTGPVAALLATALLLAPAMVPADDRAFLLAARDAVRSAFATPRADRVTLHTVRDTAFLLYAADSEARMPFVQVRCARSTTFSISLRGNTQSGITSLGLLRVGVCEPERELPGELIAGQGPVSRLLIESQTRAVPGIARFDILPYRQRALGDGLTLHTFTVLALGHGAAISPTALLTGAAGDPVVVVQFELPPRCDEVANPVLLACTDNAAFMAKLALIVRDAPGDHMVTSSAQRTPQTAR